MKKTEFTERMAFASKAHFKSVPEAARVKPSEVSKAEKSSKENQSTEKGGNASSQDQTAVARSSRRR